MKKKKEPSKPKQILQKLVLKLTAPVKMDLEIEFSKLAVFVGANDSGKTFLLKIAYALTTVGAGKDAPFPLVELAQFVFNNTFTEQNLNGLVEAVYTKGSVKVGFQEGKVISAEVKDLTNPMMITFMSTDMRTFDQMNLYLRVRKDAGKDPATFPIKMSEAYRLYDIGYMEKIIVSCPITIADPVKQSLMAYDFKEKISSIEVDLDGCAFNAVLEDGSKKNLATYGKGHQSVLNMLLGATG